jgi:hypothetical protein
MTDNSLSAHAPPPGAVASAGLSIWAPGLWLMRHLGLRCKLLVLLLSAWLPVLLALALWSNLPEPRLGIAGLDLLRGLVDARAGTQKVAHWAPLGALAAAVLAPLYLAVCVRRALSEGLDLLRHGAQDVAGQHAATVARCARELSDAHLAMQLEALEVRSAVGEVARRTVALCGMLDSDLQDAEQVGADLDAIHDEEVRSLQLMAALRTRLLSLARHCRALAEAAGERAAPRPVNAGAAVDELAAAAGVELRHCHQLSEQVGGAERMTEQHIDSMRLTADRLARRAQRGMSEAPPLMLLTRQIEASLATTLQRLEQMTASCAALRALDEASAAARHA